MTKVVIIVLLLAMVASLAVGLKELLKTPDETDNRDKFANALKFRIGIWVFLFGFLLIAIKMGWIKPSNSPHPANFNQEQQQRIDESKSKSH